MTVNRTLLILVTLMAGCGGGAHQVRETETDQLLAEARAIELIASTLDEAGIGATGGWRVNIGAPQPLEVDVRLAGGHYGIEYVTAQDRIDYGTSIPQPDNETLRILPGTGDDSAVQILILDERAFRFDPHLEHVQAGESSATDIEGRLARDVRDYIAYVRGQGGP